MKYAKTAFVFSPELGARLRLLRKRRGLSLRQVAMLMDRRRPGSFNPLARLEQGKTKYPSINLIADYLRTCGGGFEDLLDLLKPYTAQPPALREKADAAVAELLKSLPKQEQRAMLKWEKATTERREEKAAAEPEKKRPRVETDRQRVFRIVWLFIHANWNEVFEHKLYEAMLQLKDEVPRSARRDACGYGRRFFGILTRHYRHEARRKSALERVERDARSGGCSNRVVSMLRAAAEQAHRELLLAGRLDWEPTQEEIVKNRGMAPKVLKAEIRLELDEVRPMEAAGKIYGLIDALAISAVDKRLDAMKVDFFPGKKYYYIWVRQLVLIANVSGTDSAEWRACVEKWAPKLVQPEFAREAAQMVADIYNRWRVKLPPKSTVS